MLPTRLSFQVLMIIVITFFTFAGTLRHGFFAIDDHILVTQNPIVQQTSMQSIVNAFTSYDPELYVPLIILSFQIEQAIAGNAPWIYHLTNILLHIGNAILILILLRRLGLHTIAALLGALLFALHPLNAEAVSWVSARKDLLSTFFFLLSLIFYTRFQDQEDRRSYVLSLVMFVAALLSKVTVIGLPLILLLLDWLRDRPIDRRTVREKIPFLIIAIIFGVIALGGKTQNLAAVTPPETVALAIKSILFSLRLFFAPHPLASFYQQHGSIFADGTLLLSLIASIVLGCFAMYVRRWTKAPLFSLLFFVILLAPSLANFSRMGIIFFASDRYVYTAEIGLIIGIAAGLQTLLQKSGSFQWLPQGMMLIILAVSAVASFSRSALWGDSEAFFRRGLEIDPANPALHLNLGAILHKANILDEAMYEYAEAIKYGPRYADAYANLGLGLLQTGEKEKAIIILRKAVEIDPSHMNAKNTLEQAYRLK